MIQTDDKDFSRDMTTRALINTNVRALQDHISKREQSKRLDQLENDMRSLMSIMLEIKHSIKNIGTGN
jgi:hypothetical protein